MTRKALWDKLSPDEQLAWRKERQTNKKLARELSEQSEDSLTDEQRNFITLHKPIPGSERRRIRNRKKPKTSNQLKKIISSRYTILEELSKKILGAKKIVCIDVDN